MWRAGVSRIAAVAAVGGVVTLGGCTTSGPPPVRIEPPPVEVAEEGVEITPWSWCFSEFTSGACADGAPPAHPVELGGDRTMRFTYPLEGWTFEATTTPVGLRCEVTQPVQVVDGGFEVVVAEAGGGVHDVTLFGRGDQGNLSVTVRWDTGDPAPPTSC